MTSRHSPDRAILVIGSRGTKAPHVPHAKNGQTDHEFGAAVSHVLETLTAGTVLTYAEVAREAGFPGAARAVGNVLSRSTRRLPWWRVVTGTGRLVPGHEREQARLLRQEGIPVLGGRAVIATRSHHHIGCDGTASSTN